MRCSEAKHYPPGWVGKSRGDTFFSRSARGVPSPNWSHLAYAYWLVVICFIKKKKKNKENVFLKVHLRGLALVGWLLGNTQWGCFPGSPKGSFAASVPWKTWIGCDVSAGREVHPIMSSAIPKVNTTSLRNNVSMTVSRHSNIYDFNHITRWTNYAYLLHHCMPSKHA